MMFHFMKLCFQFRVNLLLKWYLVNFLMIILWNFDLFRSCIMIVRIVLFAFWVFGVFLTVNSKSKSLK